LEAVAPLIFYGEIVFIGGLSVDVECGLVQHSILAE
jgi:hypothetical protein